MGHEHAGEGRAGEGYRRMMHTYWTQWRVDWKREFFRCDDAQLDGWESNLRDNERWAIPNLEEEHLLAAIRAMALAWDSKAPNPKLRHLRQAARDAVQQSGVDGASTYDSCSLCTEGLISFRTQASAESGIPCRCDTGKRLMMIWHKDEGDRARIRAQRDRVIAWIEGLPDDPDHKYARFNPRLQGEEPMAGRAWDEWRVKHDVKTLALPEPEVVVPF